MFQMLHFVTKLLVIVGLSLIVFLLGCFLSKKELSNQVYLSPFECGFTPAQTSKMSFSSRFFIMALIFLIFDVELILLFPFLLTSQIMNLFSMILFLLFINLLSFGLYYEWNFSMMEWMYYFFWRISAMNLEFMNM